MVRRRPPSGTGSHSSRTPRPPFDTPRGTSSRSAQTPRLTRPPRVPHELAPPTAPIPRGGHENLGRLGRLAAWLDGRTGYRQALRQILDHPVRGGASFARVFGSLLVFLLVNQALTGSLLAAFYSPSATAAWASVAYIQDQVWLGWFIRGMHSAGASGMMVLLLCHMVQVTVYGAYRAPREVTWLTGLLLTGLVMGFSLTGYLLPWDQKGYWATQVVTSLMGSIPLIGTALQTLIQGGPTCGNLTLTHFFALHALFLPGLMLTFVVGHIALSRRHGVTPHWNLSESAIARRTQPLWPRQLTYNLGGMMALLTVLLIWVVKTHGADLSAPADPTAAYDARPEWYFLPLYELLKNVPAPLELVIVLGAPLLAGGTLAALPFLDKADSAHPRLRRAPVALLGCGLLLALVLGAASKIGDAGDRDFQRGREVADRRAAYARRLALQGVLPAGGTAVYRNDPLEQGRVLFVERCAKCHVLGEMRPPPADEKGPELTHYSSRAWIAALLRDPDAPSYFGKTKINDMKPVRLPPPEFKALVEYVYSLTGDKKVDAALVEAGRKSFAARSCETCHELDGRTEGEGPNLRDRGSTAWLRGLLEKPSAPVYFSDDNEMPSFADKLSAEEIDSLANYVAAQRDL